MESDVRRTGAEWYSFDALDRLSFDSGASVADPTYTYDGNGNRLRREAGAFAEQDFTYLPGSNRQSATQYDGMGNKQESYATYNESGRLGFLSDAVTTDTMVLAYNGLGELARTVMYHPDPCSVEQLLLSRDDYLFTPDGRALAIRTFNTASVNTDYVWVDELPVAQFVDSYDSQMNLIGTTLTYLHPDHLGTPRIGTSQGKAITWRYRSDAFGIPDAQTSGVVRLRLPGQVSLGVAGVHYNYYRDYEAGEGRYLESDPIGFEGGLNTYGYVEQNPLKSSDPTGEGSKLFAACTVLNAAGNAYAYYSTLSDLEDTRELLEGQLVRVNKEISACDGTENGVRRQDELEKIRKDLVKELARGIGRNIANRQSLYGLRDLANFAIGEGACLGLLRIPDPF